MFPPHIKISRKYNASTNDKAVKIMRKTEILL